MFHKIVNVFLFLHVYHAYYQVHGAQDTNLRFEIQPNNGTVELNTNVTLLCSYNNNGTFFIFRSNVEQPLVAYNKKESPMFAVGDVWKNEIHQHTWVHPSTEQSAFGITFKSSWADEGEYWCEMQNMLKKGKSNSANLTISLPSGQPELHVSNGATKYKSGDVISINCTGDVGRPARYLSLNSTVGSVENQQRTVWTTSNHTTFESVQANIELTKDYQNQSFCCSVQESNVFNFVCSPPLTIYVAVSDVILEPIKNSYFIDEVIHCHANGWPEPTYSWMKLRSSFENADLSINGADLIINTSNTTIWPDGFDTMDFEYTCKATNIVLNVMYVMSKTHYFHVKRERLATKPIETTTVAPVYFTHSAKISWLKLHEQALKIGAIITAGVCVLLIILFSVMHCAFNSKKEINYHKLESERGR